MNSHTYQTQNTQTKQRKRSLCFLFLSFRPLCLPVGLEYIGRGLPVRVHLASTQARSVPVNANAASEVFVHRVGAVQGQNGPWVALRQSASPGGPVGGCLSVRHHDRVGESRVVPVRLCVTHNKAAIGEYTESRCEPVQGGVKRTPYLRQVDTIAEKRVVVKSMRCVLRSTVFSTCASQCPVQEASTAYWTLQ